MTFKKAFLYAALIACIPLSLSLWDRYKPVKTFEQKKVDPNLTRMQILIDSTIMKGGGIIYTDTLGFKAGDTVFLRYSPVDSSFNPIIEHSKIPKK